MYAVPLVEALRRRIVVRLRGLVLVPSRDLADQVHAVLRPLCDALGLKLGLVAGLMSFAKEAEELVGVFGDENGNKRYESNVDVVVATPGRLIDHLDKTQGFTLQHLTVLVVDEADRMLTQAYQDWLDRVYRAAHAVGDAAVDGGDRVQISNDAVHIPDQSSQRRNPAKLSSSEQQEFQHLRLRRILCSATLTKNPQKLASLALHRPIMIDASSVPEGGANVKRVRSISEAKDEASVADEDERMIISEERLPATLSEKQYFVTIENKPLVFLSIVSEILNSVSEEETAAARVLVFCSSVARASKLYSLVSHVFGKKICALISSEASREERASALNRLKKRSVRILIGSDVAARGIDVQGLEYVLSYDMPAHATTYVHRVGRTARAGMSGTSIVLVRTDQARHFREIREKLKVDPPKFDRLDQVSLEKNKSVFEEWKKMDQSTPSDVHRENGAKDKVKDDEDIGR